LRTRVEARWIETGILLQRHTGTPRKIELDLTHRAPIVDNSRRTGATAPRSYFSELSLKIQFVAWWARLSCPGSASDNTKPRKAAHEIRD